MRKFLLNGSRHKKNVFLVFTAAILLSFVLGVILYLNSQHSGNTLNPSQEDGVPGIQTQPCEKTKQNKGMEIYLVKGDYREYTGETGMDSFELETEPLLSGDDIHSYNWDIHSMKIKSSAKINKELLKRRFVVTVDGEKIYQGAFWSALYSMIPPEISIYLDSMEEKSGYILLAIGSWSPGGTIQPNVKNVLDNIKIKKSLELYGQLYKPYQPSNFPAPQQISVYHKQAQYTYAYSDWEKRDEMLKILDSRFVNSLNYTNMTYSPEKDNKMWQNETVISLHYKDNVKGFKFSIEGKETEIIFNELIMPVTGNNSDLIFFKGTDNYPEYDYTYKHGFTGYQSVPIGKLSEFNDIELLLTELPEIQKEIQEPEGIHLSYNNILRMPCYYEFNPEEAKFIREAAKSGKVINVSRDKAPGMLGLFLEFDKDGKKWYRVCDDRQTLFSNGKYYRNPGLTKFIFDIASEKCGYEMVDPSSFKGIVKATYRFKTNTRTYESTIEDRAVLDEIEKELQKVKHSDGGACPYNDGVLTLTFSDRRTKEIAMASDDCPGMFVDGNYLVYSDELHTIFEKNFDNFPYMPRH
jgi:hypothetical protein